jgi:hypothetical protein
MWRLYKTGIGLTTGFIGSHTVTHNYSVYASQLTTIESVLFHWRLRLQLCNHCCNQLLWRPLPLLINWSRSAVEYWTPSSRWPPTSGYVAREQTTKKTPLRFPYCWNDFITGTDRKENAGRFHCCMATACKQASHCWLLTYSVHVTIRYTGP